MLLSVEETVRQERAETTGVEVIKQREEKALVGGGVVGWWVVRWWVVR